MSETPERIEPPPTEAVLVGFDACAPHGFALPCFAAGPDEAQLFIARCAVSGERASPILAFEAYLPAAFARLSDPRSVRVGDAWTDVFLWDGAPHVGDAENLWEALGAAGLLEAIATDAPLTFLDLIPESEAARRTGAVRSAFGFLSGRYGEARAIEWRDQVWAPGRVRQGLRRQPGADFDPNEAEVAVDPSAGVRIRLPAEALEGGLQLNAVHAEIEAMAAAFPEAWPVTLTLSLAVRRPADLLEPASETPPAEAPPELSDADDLRQRFEALQQANAELQERVHLLAVQNQQVEAGNREVEAARIALEDRALQLALSARSRSERLAEMNRELRAPLNSVLILSRILADDSQGNLSEKQREFAQTIHAAASDLLVVIDALADPPRTESPPTAQSAAQLPSFLEEPGPLDDDRDGIVPGDPVVLIVEDDVRFASILLNLVHNAGLKGVVTAEGGPALSMARRFSPDVIMLDTGLPDMDGLALLDVLKQTPETRHIPVHVISDEGPKGLALALGAFAFTHKPVEREVVVAILEDAKTLADKTDRRLALVGRDGALAEALRQGFADLEVTDDFASLVSRPASERPDAVVMDGTMMGAPQLIEQLRQADGRCTPAVVYVPDELDPDDDRRLRLAVFGGLVRMARSIDQSVEEAARLLHAEPRSWPAPAGSALARQRHDGAELAGRKVLMIDDDIRNIFSLASALEEYGLELSYAESGRAGLDLLDHRHEVDLVLIDTMMPDMDGYETIREIRSRPHGADLPIVALSGRGTKGDRQKSVQAGASDHVSKPVDIDHLVSVMRVAIMRAQAGAQAEFTSTRSWTSSSVA